MIKINQILILFCLILAFSCTRSGSILQKQRGEFFDFTSIDKLTEINYDTLDGIFLYESYVESYISGEDAVTKSGGLIKDMPAVNLNIYKSGYYLCDLNLLKKYKNINPLLNFDSTSLASFQSHLMGIYWTHSGDNKTQFNPYCGLYYSKFFLKAIVVNIGNLQQKTPLFLDCKDFIEYKTKNKGLNYEYHSLPTFLITDVISWQEIK